VSGLETVVHEEPRERVLGPKIHMLDSVEGVAFLLQDSRRERIAVGDERREDTARLDHRANNLEEVSRVRQMFEHTKQRHGTKLTAFKKVGSALFVEDLDPLFAGARHGETVNLLTDGSPAAFTRNTEKRTVVATDIKNSVVRGGRIRFNVVHMEMVVLVLEDFIFLLLGHFGPRTLNGTVILDKDVLAQDGIDVQKAAFQTLDVRKAILLEKGVPLGRAADETRAVDGLRPIDLAGPWVDAPLGRITDLFFHEVVTRVPMESTLCL